MTSQQSLGPPTAPPDPEDPKEPMWGAPHQPGTWSVRQTLAAVGVATVVAALGGAAIYAATSTGSGPFGMHGGPGPGGWGGDGRGSGQGGTHRANPVADALHGQFVVPDGDGGYLTSMVQTGTLAAVSDTSITARSADGYTMTYSVARPGSTDGFAVNDTVTIDAGQRDGHRDRSGRCRPREHGWSPTRRSARGSARCSAAATSVRRRFLR